MSRTKNPHYRMRCGAPVKWITATKYLPCMKRRGHKGGHKE